ncbi:MAG: hypothetical protein IJS81_02820, partial [Selenomonadaceae bacterium]|nr:hypothetical protein [Selenomonadaceae bacterium]
TKTLGNLHNSLCTFAGILIFQVVPSESLKPIPLLLLSTVKEFPFVVLILIAEIVTSALATSLSFTS